MAEPGADPPPPAPVALVVDIDGYEGPLDLLLVLARRQKVDLRRISVRQLVDQYLDFIANARDLRIELAADWLVMASWLAYLKSRLLLPPDPDDDEPDAEDLAARLAWRLERLEAMREAAAALMVRPRLGHEVFARGAAEGVVATRRTEHSATLLALLQAYARIRTRDDFRPLAFDRRDICSPEQALEGLRPRLAGRRDWALLDRLVPMEWRTTPPRQRSARAAHFVAALELVKQGEAEVRQGAIFAPVEIRGAGR